MSATAKPYPTRDLPQITLSVVSIAVLLVGSLWVMRPFLLSMLWATMIVVSTWPLMTSVQRHLGGRRGAAVAVMTLALLLTVLVPLYLAVSAILDQTDRVAELARALPTYRLPPPPPWIEALPLVGHRAAGRWLALSAMTPDELATWMTPHVATALTWFAAKAGSFGTTLVQFLLTAIIAAIMYAKGEAAEERVRLVFRRLSGDRGDAIVTLSGKAIRAVAMGIVVTAVLQAGIAAAGLFGVGVPLAGFVTAVVLVLCIAQLGPLLALVPCVVWLYASGSPVRGTVLLVVTVVAQMIDNFVRPVLIKRGAELSLLIIFPGVIGGLLWLGIIGLFIGPVVLAVGSTLLDGWITSGLPDERRASEPAPAPPPVAAGGAGAA